MLWLLGSLVVVLLGISVVRGAPYVPTHSKQVDIALDLLDLKPGQHLVDVGSGDGRVLIAAAQRGIKATGYEINPLLCLLTWWRARKYRPLVKIVWGDMWGKKLPEDLKGVFVFTMGRYMPKLEAKIKSEGLSGVRMVSHGFELLDRKPKKKKEAIVLYEIR